MMKVLILHMLYYIKRLLQIKINVQMEDANLDNVVSLVNTYTTDWKHRKSSEKRKGITRITGMSKQKYWQNPIIPVATNQNFNYSNYKYTDERKQKIVFHQLVEKLQIHKEQIQKEVKNKEPTPLAQSHYINCQQDVEQWLRVKQKLEQRINNLQIQNNFLKINVGIQQQYIIKIQTEVDDLRLKCQPSIPSIVYVQTQTQERPQLIQVQAQTQEQISIRVEPKHIQNCQIQCELQEKGYQQFQKFGREVEEQTKEFFNIIKKLQDEKQLLINQNNTLLQRLLKAQQRLEQQNNNRQEIKNTLSKQISNLVQTEYNLKMRLQSFEQSKEKMLSEVNQQNKLYEREKELRQQIEKQKQAVLKVQMQKISKLQAKYHQYKKQLDELVSFLQQKNKTIKDRQPKIQTNQRQRQNKELTNQYEERIIKMKQTIQNYLKQLLEYRIQKQDANQRKQAIKSPQVILKKNDNEWDKKQKQIGQDISYLLQKIAYLQSIVNDSKREKAQKQRQILGNQNLLEVQYDKIRYLEQQNETIRLQLEVSTKECRDIQHLINTFQNQRMQLKNVQYQLSQQNSNIKTELIVISQQLQSIKQKCSADLISYYALKEENQKQKELIKQLEFLLQNNSDRLKRQMMMSQQQRNRLYLQKEQINRQVDTLKTSSIKQNNTIQSLRRELLQISLKYEQMAKLHAHMKRQNFKLVQQKLQLKQKSEVIQRQNELIVKSHQLSVKQMEQHICKLQSELQRQRQLGVVQIKLIQQHIFKLQSELQLQREVGMAEKNEWQKQKQLVKKDYDILYNKYVKYKNIAFQSQPPKH